MSKLTVNSKSTFTEDIGGRSVFIDDIQLDADIELEFVFEDGEKEKHSIVSGSKFSSPDKIINEVIFHNKNAFDVDIAFHYSSFLIYDEAKVIGDVKSLTRFDNLTPDGNRFFGSYRKEAVAGNFSWVGVQNPLSSIVPLYITDLLISCSSDYALMSKDNNQSYAQAPFSVSNKDLYGSDPEGYIVEAANIIQYPASGSINDNIGYIPTDTASSPTVFKYGNAPMKLDVGEAILFRGGAVNIAISINAQWFEGER